MEHNVMRPNVCFGQCKCCLKNTYLKNMWEPLETNGEWEVYGQMLVDCFGIDWTIQVVEEDNICQVCISKLRVCVEFKKQVQESQATLLESVQEPPPIEIEIPESNEIPKVVAVASNEKKTIESSSKNEETPLISSLKNKEVLVKPTTDKEETYTISNVEKENKSDANLYGEASQSSLNEDDEDDDDDDSSSDAESEFVNSNANGEKKTFEEVEFLEEEVLEEVVELDNDDDEDFEPAKKKRKWPKKLPPRMRNLNYRQYTEEDLMKAVEAVRSREMTRRKASELYKIPRRTISTKLYEEREVEDPYNMKDFIKAIRAVLTHTNATFFKIRTPYRGYSCFFCRWDGSSYIRSPEELRTHTHSEHEDKIVRTEFVVRPHYLNQMVRVDVYNLSCNCGEDVTWDDLLDHLKMKHEVAGIDDVWNNIIPYSLSMSNNAMACQYPKCDFTGVFSKLDTHMNLHYPNYLCGDCGKPFITIARLKSHEQFHKVGVFSCKECELLFTSHKARKSHIDRVHRKKCRFRCSFCPESFLTDQQKKRHLNSQHKDKLESQGKRCKPCKKTFWPRDYWRHVKAVHGPPSFVCSSCGECFKNLGLSANHRCNADTATVKKYQCNVCLRMFFTIAAVATHRMRKDCQPNCIETVIDID